MLALNPLIAEQLNYEPAALLADLDVCLQQMNPDQRSAYDQIIASVETLQGQLFFLNGPGRLSYTTLSVQSFAALGRLCFVSPLESWLCSSTVAAQRILCSRS